jgi:hypothetical protein
VERLAPDGFDDVDAVLPPAERAAIVQGYAAASVSAGATGPSRSAG